MPFTAMLVDAEVMGVAASCAVIGLPSDEWGETVHAVVVLADRAEATADELREHARRHIGGYKVPRTVDFVDRLPISGAGKVLKRALRAQYGKAVLGR